MELTDTQEDFLKAVCELSQEKEKVRVKHLSDHLSISEPSVHSMVKKLCEFGLLTHEKYRKDIKLTDKGAKKAKSIIRKHEILYTFFTKVLQLPPEIAEYDSCKAVHHISNKSIKKIKEMFL